MNVGSLFAGIGAGNDEAAVVAARQAAPEAARKSRSRARFAHGDAERGAEPELRSPRHPEVAS